MFFDSGLIKCALMVGPRLALDKNFKIHSLSKKMIVTNGGLVTMLVNNWAGFRQMCRYNGVGSPKYFHKFISNFLSRLG